MAGALALTEVPPAGWSWGMNSAQLASTDAGFGDAALRLAVARTYAQRPHVELYLRWMQEVRGFQPSTDSRRLSVVAGSYRTSVIDAVLEHSPA